MLRFVKAILYLFVMSTMVACSVSNRIEAPRNLEMMYNPASSTLHPKYSVYNTSDTTALIVGEIESQEFLYNKAVDEKSLIAQLQVIYNLYDLNKKERLSDSSTINFQFDKKINNTYRKIQIPIKAEIGNNYILEIITTDKNRNSNHYTFLNVDRNKNSSIGDYRVVDTLNQSLFINKNIGSVKPFIIQHYGKKFDSLNVFYFSKSESIAKHPNNPDSVSYNFTNPDSAWVFYNDSMKYDFFSESGTYYFTQYDKPINGFALHQFGAFFPGVKYPHELIKPLEYFGFEDTISQNDTTGKLTKLQVDNFWLDIAQNMDRSRDLVKIFYNRVVNANKYFTSFDEGWRTDRGMIYIIYGLPDYIFKSDLEEKWIYSPLDLGPGYSFTFKYYSNPFSLNHYILDRQKLKDTGWESMIKMWKKGEVIYYQK